MQRLEINNQRAVIFEERADLLLATSVVLSTYGEDHFLVAQNPDTQQCLGDTTTEVPDRRLTLFELRDEMDDGDLNQPPLPYALIGGEAQALIHALGRQARGLKSWRQACASEALISMGLTRAAKLDRTVSVARTAVRHLVPTHIRPRSHKPAVELQLPEAKHFTQAQVMQMVKEVPNLVVLLDQEERSLVDTFASGAHVAA